MIRCRTSYSSYPQDLWKRSPILRKLAIRVQRSPDCSKSEQAFNVVKMTHQSKSVLLVHLIRLICALMKLHSRKMSRRGLYIPSGGRV